MNRNSIRVAAAVPVVRVADPSANAKHICSLVDKAEDGGASLVVFPRLCLSGATCGDLFCQKLLLQECQKALDIIIRHSSGKMVTILVSGPMSTDGQVDAYKAIIRQGKLIRTLPDGQDGIFEAGKARFAFEYTPKAEIIVECASDGELMDTFQVREQSIRTMCVENATNYIYCGAGWGESTTDNVFAGAAVICTSDGTMTKGKDFQRNEQIVFADLPLDKGKPGKTTAKPLYIENAIESKKPFVPKDKALIARAFEIQSMGLCQRMDAIGCRRAVIGVSGGLDSTLALLCTVHSFDVMGWSRKGITAVTMPGKGTSSRTHGNAGALMSGLGVNYREIPISRAFQSHLEDIGHDAITQDTAYENAQARERTQILMDIANMENGIVIGTGDLSESALGWCTYNGDHMSNYAVNASVPKTLVRAIVKWAAREMFPEIAGILLDVVATPVSPELKGSGQEIEQVTEEVIGPYELHDFFLFRMLHVGITPKEILSDAYRIFDGQYTEEKIRKYLKIFISRFFSSQFKRSCSPDSPAVTSVSLSPRTSWQMPSDASAKLWLDDLSLMFTKLDKNEKETDSSPYL